jgi:hypothetical protein
MHSLNWAQGARKFSGRLLQKAQIASKQYTILRSYYIADDIPPLI